MTWILQLNDMRSPKSEVLTAVCRADTAEEILALLDRERVESYETPFDPTFGHTWQKSFREGGPLEWFNAPFGEVLDELSREGHVVEFDFDVHIQRMRAALERDLAQIPHIGLVVHGEEVRLPELTDGASP